MPTTSPLTSAVGANRDPDRRLDADRFDLTRDDHLNNTPALLGSAPRHRASRRVTPGNRTPTPVTSAHQSRGGYICFGHETGFTRRPPQGRPGAGAAVPRS
ncbi:hypothetical protein ACWCYL_33805 [Streptomyces sp. 900105755]